MNHDHKNDDHPSPDLPAEDDETLAPGESPGDEERTLSATAAIQAETHGTPPTDTIPGYRILGLLGEGGMGVVWEAEQERPKRRVALKVMRRDHVVDDLHRRLFLREAETLARLKHPNIAAIYASGHTEEGHDYFAMELARGSTLDEWLASRPARPDAEELKLRLGMFRMLCEAVHYAHQRGVIHRDLKPANIIVTDAPESSSSASTATDLPTLKILDFGLARITDADVAATQVSEVGAIKGTLQYMSPEQARGEVEAIDVRTDVYALGIILYEMLTGRRPYEVTRAALIEAIRVICDDTPTPLGHSWSGVSRLDADIETIAGKAMEKEADRRYGSAAALADDVGRFLASQPILARPPSAVYQLRKMVTRHRSAFAASVAVLLILILSSVVSTSLFFKAKRESDRARVEALKSDQVATFVADMLEGVGPAVALGRDTTVVREILDQTADRVGADLEDQPEVEAAVRKVLGNTYRSLGELESAERQLRATLETNRSALGDEHLDTLIALNDLALVIQQRGRYDEADELFTTSLEGERRLFGDQHPETLRAISNYGILLAEIGRFDEAEVYHREALDGLENVEGKDHEDTITALSNLGILLHSMGRTAEAEEVLREALEAKRRIHPPDHPDILNGLNSLAVMLDNQGRYDEAESIYVEALEGHRRVLGDDHPETLRTMSNFGVFLTRAGRPDEGERYLREALDARRRTLGDDHYDTLISINTLSFWYFRQGRRDESEVLIREVLERGKRTMGSEHPDYLVWVHNMSHLLRIRGKMDEAEAHIREVLGTRQRVLGPAHPDTLLVLWDLASFVDNEGRPDEAERLFEEGLTATVTELGEADQPTINARTRLAAFYLAHERADKARVVVRAGLAAMKSAAVASDDPGEKNAYAWELLTCKPEDLQDPANALVFALSAAELSDRQDPDILDTLALANYRTDDHAQAVEVEIEALGLIPKEDSERRAPFEIALETYRKALSETPPD